MSTDRKEQGSTRQHILQLLRRHGQMTAVDLSEALEIGAVGIRQHLALLERDGLVRIAGLRRNIGRPSHLYTLTSDAERIFPKRYDDLVLDVIAFVACQGGEEAVGQVFMRRREELSRRLGARFAGKTRAERVAMLAQFLTDEGYMCEYEELEDGSFLLTEHNCPVDCVARRYPQLCVQELALYQDLLDAPIIRETTMASGDHCCRYRIPA